MRKGKGQAQWREGQGSVAPTPSGCSVATIFLLVLGQVLQTCSQPHLAHFLYVWSWAHVPEQVQAIMGTVRTWLLHLPEVLVAFCFQDSQLAALGSVLTCSQIWCHLPSQRSLSWSQTLS